MEDAENLRTDDTAPRTEGFRISKEPLVGIPQTAGRPNELPASYGTDLLYVVARDPNSLFLYWDLNWTRLFVRAGLSPRQIHLRIYRGEDSVEATREINPFRGYCYVDVAAAGTTYFCELGCFDGNVWKSLARSGTTIDAGIGRFRRSLRDFRDVANSPQFPAVAGYLPDDSVRRSNSRPFRGRTAGKCPDAQGNADARGMVATCGRNSRVPQRDEWPWEWCAEFGTRRAPAISPTGPDPSANGGAAREVESAERRGRRRELERRGRRQLRREQPEATHLTSTQVRFAIELRPRARNPVASATRLPLKRERMRGDRILYHKLRQEPNEPQQSGI